MTPKASYNTKLEASISISRHTYIKKTSAIRSAHIQHAAHRMSDRMISTASHSAANGTKLVNGTNGAKYMRSLGRHPGKNLAGNRVDGPGRKGRAKSMSKASVHTMSVRIKGTYADDPTRYIPSKNGSMSSDCPWPEGVAMAMRCPHRYSLTSRSHGSVYSVAMMTVRIMASITKAGTYSIPQGRAQDMP